MLSMLIWKCDCSSVGCAVELQQCGTFTGSAPSWDPLGPMGTLGLNYFSPSHLLPLSTLMLIPLKLPAKHSYIPAQRQTICLVSLHYRLRAIRGVPLGVVNFTSHFIIIQIFQILFLSPVSFYTHPNISDIFVGDEIYLFNLTFHDIANY